MMDMWLGLGVVLVVLALSYFTPRRKCGGGCQGCGSSCAGEQSRPIRQAADETNGAGPTSEICEQAGS